MPVNQFSNYPGGFSHGVILHGLPVVNMHHGNIFWVNSATGNDSGANDGSRTKPYATLEYAINQAVADNGDIIMLAPKHAETISSATALNFDKAGISIIGLGKGDNRPTFTLDTANTTTIPVSADDITIQNCKFVGNFLSIASCFTVAAAANFSILGCDFDDTSAILGFLSIVTTTVSVNADNLNFSDNTVRSIATTNPGPTLDINGTMRGLTVQRNHVVHTVDNNNVAVLINHAALVMTSLLVTHNLIHCVNTDTATGAVLILTTATTGDGIVAYNLVRCLDVAAAIIVTAGQVTYGMFENYLTGETTQLSGVLLPEAGAQ